MTYPLSADGEPAEPLSPSPRFPELEERILAFWQKDDTFRASVAQREGAQEWVFYDGPPFANGLPHYGHLLTGYAKDLFPRFQTMRGRQVHRRFGWDTHGLPAELEAERQLGITDKSQIEEMGIAAFNQAARESVLRYTKEWEEYVTRMARWVDFENDYKTLDVTFMESVLWGFKQLYDKGLAYEGYRVLPYCWRDQTPLSNHELRMDDDVYKMRQDQSVTVTFPLTGEKADSLGLAGVDALAWTTTPWTLPTNAALAVGPGIEYAVVPAADGGARYLLAADTIASYAKELGYATAEEARAAIERTVLGTELAGIRYERLWDYYADAEEYGTENAWQILVAEYVETGEGTGIVHQAPAYGEDDQLVCAQAGIPVILSVDDGGRFLPVIEGVSGLQVFDANPVLIKQLRAMGRLFKVASYEHSYPHCWRCRNPLIYKAVSSWFVKVPEFRDRMGELNQEINWVPENVKDGQFGKWLSGARDWSISRNRYWGSPIPIWKSDNLEFPRVDAYGSLAELERDFGRMPVNTAGEPDLHRPFIDELTRPNPDDPSSRSTMRRIEDVFDVWFDSGSMPYAQVHYPFENEDWFASHSPADFIVEYIGQTRGWFYVMHVLSTAIFDRPAFTNVLSHGIVLGSDGQKMSKSLRNYPDVSEVFDRDGADAMRWFLMSSSVIRGGNISVTEEAIRSGVREFLLPLWNTYYFFALYANAATPQPAGGYRATWRTDSAGSLDRYILAKTRRLIEEVTVDLEALDSPLAAAKLGDFADVLTNWYVRRSRDRFWAGDNGEADWRDAFDTLYTVLETLTRVAAPLAPLIADTVWKGLTGKRSVHLEDWPVAEEFPEDEGLVTAMDRVREVASAGLALRKSTGRRVRLPLAALTVVGDSSGIDRFSDILKDELNVKHLVFVPLAEGGLGDFGITRRLSVNARALGPRVGKDVQRIIQASKSGDWSIDGGTVTAGGTALLDGEFELVLESADPSNAVAFLDSEGFVILDTVTTPELEAEGLARDVIRAVQDSRRSAGLDVSDRIDLRVYFASRDEAAAVDEFRRMIADETLATDIDVLAAESFDGDYPGLEALAAAHGTGDAFRSLVTAGQYANIGDILVELDRHGKGIDV
ncbi:isoleucyl-tRNA synthetase [Cryobacterium mesophilum]|uniref:Isoleucine--tRNA ligase n=1 Tax=Terrimesophilobacter mesophilus TaxID=433647 RepID=A0A4R8VAP1_9MICO|nr:isoleucine--tRNA ligase [Terrimesophilobacter mesophilus]MBB5632318.1 isoleucyl-tRNA synthetase [Terrimesophilobacter mesophilus]TFB79160.1 isoleucine--tRNA ligase [Terrimesophilobacter mesophilus]